MELTGLHILLTYKCIFECDHCFVWGSPRQSGVLTLGQLQVILQQAKEAGVGSIYFEGGEPFLYFAILVKAVRMAADLGFEVGIVSNAYWASSVADAQEWLRPFAGRLSDFTVSSDLFHCSDALGELPQNALVAAKWLNIPTGLISVAGPDVEEQGTRGQLEGASSVMYRGRAAQLLGWKAEQHPWDGLDSCPHEDLRDPGRMHLDPLGNLHICQGISLGNVFQKPLVDICKQYDPDSHPICGPLLNGGPVSLVTEYSLRHDSHYADACQLCYMARLQLRSRFPAILGPDQMYGVGE